MVVVIGGVAIRLNAKKAPETVNEVPVTVTTETPAPIGITAVAMAPEATLIANGTYTIAADKSTAAWDGSRPLLTDYKDTGTINIKSGSFLVADNKLASGTMIFDMNSIHTLSTGKKMGESMMEKHLKSDAFFNVEKYPTAEFTMKEAVAGVTPGAYTVKGDLTIKGITNAVELPVTISTVEKTMTIDSNVTLDRTKWDIRYGSGKFFQNLANNIIADDFNLALKIVADAK